MTQVLERPETDVEEFDRAPYSHAEIQWVRSIPFFTVHLLPLLVIFTGISRTAMLLFAVTYFGRMFIITAGYHRYFAHKSYRLNRFWQFVLAYLCTTAAQKGPLWWSGHHRNHHKFSDTPRDIHSPRSGFWWSHVGWILSNRYSETPYEDIKDFAKYPELVWLNKHDWVGPWSLGVVCFLIGGWSGLVVGLFASTVLLWHTTFLVNSAAHVFGRRRYETEDTSRNSLLIALVTGGEGWHNNHHRYQSSARQGFRWWQIDTTYYGLWLLSKIGIVKDLRPVPKRVIDEPKPGRQAA
jgi:stearoyl-CoA desaturase (delta-9 desaturase)